MNPEIDVTIESDLWAVLEAPEALAEKAIFACVRETKAKLPKGAELSLLLCDDAAIRALNKQWLGKDEATNVLSFPSASPDAFEIPALIGDVVIAFETASREAADEGKTLSDHVTHLIVHGFLHLLGYEHDSDAEAEEMERSERRILAQMGIADPYADSVPVRETVSDASP